MSVVRPQAHLQRSILIALTGSSFRSVVEIAERVSSSRPSVSRALQRLQSAGIVAKVDGAWELTSLGREEVASVNLGLAPGVIRALERRSRLERQLATTRDLTAGLTGIAAMQQRFGALAATPDLTGISALQNSIGEGFRALATTRDLTAGLTGIAAMQERFGALAATPDLTGISALQNSIGEHFRALVTTRDLTAGLTGIAAMQERFSALAATPDLMGISALQKVALTPFMEANRAALSGVQLQLNALASAPAVWTSALTENLALSGRIAADVSVLRDAVDHVALTARSMHLMDSAVGAVVSAHHDQLAASIERLLVPPVPGKALGEIVWPTATTASFTSAARAVVDPREEVLDPLDAVESLVGDVANRLEHAGAPAAARDLRAAATHIRTRPPGWSKTGPHLMREALREALDELAPRAVVPADDKGVVSRRAQVTWLCASDHTLAVWIDVTATNVGKLHELLSAEAKNSGGSRLGWQGHLGLLEAAVGVLRTVAERAVQRREQDRS